MKRLWLPLALSLFAFVSCKKDETTGTVPVQSKVFVAIEDGESIAVIDPATNVLTGNISVADNSGNMMMVHNVQATPDGKSVWATVNPMNPGSIDQLVVVDPIREMITARIEIGLQVHLAHVVFDDLSQHAFVSATDSDMVVEVNVATHAIEQRFFLAAGSQPHGMRFHSGNLYVSNLGTGMMSVITVATGQIQNIPVGGMAVQSAVTKDGQFVFSSIYDQKSIFKYNTSTGVSTSVPLPSFAQGPIQIYPSPDGTRLYICDQGLLLGRPASNQVFVMDIPNETIIDSVRVGNAPHGVVVSPDGKTVYITSTEDNTVNVIDAATLEVVATIPVGIEPNGISYWSSYGSQP